MSQLIVLSGVAGAGKDAVAKLLVEQHGWVPYSLAAPMKRFVGDMFGFTKEQLYGPSSARNAPDPRWARPCMFCKQTGSVCWGSELQGSEIVYRYSPCEDCEGVGSINDNSPRRILQLLGEEWMRQMIHVDALTMRARPELEGMLAAGARIVINDARNDNDRDNLHRWLGARRVDVRTRRARRARPDEAWRQHPSENRLAADADVEHVVNNDESWPFPSLPVLVSTMLTKLFDVPATDRMAAPCSGSCP
jgi:hypothetical protein